MRHRHVVSLSALASVLALMVWAAFSMAGQNPAPANSARGAKAAATPRVAAPPRTAWGEPDLQGVWFVLADVPLERSAANAGNRAI